jgi:hypothetical protein
MVIFARTDMKIKLEFNLENINKELRMKPDGKNYS